MMATKDEQTRATDEYRVVIGGPDAHVVPKHSQPWVVRLGAFERSGLPLSRGCGGTLISSRHVLTAAHCFDTCKGGVWLGDHSISDDNDGGKYFAIQDRGCIKHPKWEKGIRSTILWYYIPLIIYIIRIYVYFNFIFVVLRSQQKQVRCSYYRLERGC